MKKFTPFIIFIFIIFCCAKSYGQQVTNVASYQEGKKLKITYTLTGKQGVSNYEIKLYVSTDDGMNWQPINSGISGDVGTQITPGTNKTITWDVLATRERLQGDKIRFKVTATYNESGNYTETSTGSASGIEMIFIQGGTFTMGCTPDGDSDCSSDEKPRHSVTLSNFYMGKTEVTNAQYCAFLNEKGNQTESGAEWINLSGSYEGEKCRISKSGSSFYVQSGYDNYPVIYVSWYGAKAFCDWVSSKTGKNYRLPTEAQWEYAARSKGKDYKYAWGNGKPTKSKGGNVADETAKSKFSDWTIWSGYTDGYVYTAPVNSFGVNDIGLADMTGNVWEWCGDWYSSDYYKTSPTNNPENKTSASRRVCRSGSWSYGPQHVRCSFRGYYTPVNRYVNIGFRLIRMD